MELKIFKIVIFLALFIFAINLSIKIFNTYDAWLGIGMGIASCGLIIGIIKQVGKLFKD